MSRNLNKTLQLFATDGAMDYCNEFDEVKRILEYCHHNAKPFNSMCFRSGNEYSINMLLHRLETYFVQQQLVDAESFETLTGAATLKLRQITLFLFINTQCQYVHNLADNEQLSHLVNVCPQLPTFLLITLMWDLKLDRFFNETLSYAPIWFSYQHIAVAVEQLKFIEDSFDWIKKTAALLCDTMTTITRARIQMAQDERQQLKKMFSVLHDTALTALLNFYTPDASRMDKLSKRKKKVFLGFVMLRCLEMALHAFDAFEKPAQEQLQFYADVFQQSEQSAQPTSPKRRQSNETLEQLVVSEQLELIRLMLNATQSAIRQVALNDFVEWAELDMPDKRTLQQTVAQLAWLVCERMQGNEQLQHDVKQELQIIAQRPLTLEERVAQAKLGDILNNLEDADISEQEKAIWFNAIFNYKIALGNEECLQSIKQHLQFINVQHCQQLLDFMKIEMQRRFEEQQELSDDAATADFQQFSKHISEDYAEIIEILLLAMQQFETTDMLQLLQQHLQLFGNNNTICLLDAIDYSERIHTFFNRWCNDFDFKRFVGFCFENPAKSWHILFLQALSIPHHVRTYCHALQQMNFVSKCYFKQHMKLLQERLLHFDAKVLPVFISEVYFCLNPTEQQQFLMQSMREEIAKLLELSAFEQLLIYVETLSMIAAHGETEQQKPLNFGELTAPTLLLVGQVLDKARWDIISYTEVRSLLVDKCISFIAKNSKKYLPKATAAERKWLANVSKDLQPMNKYYYQKFALKPEENAKNFDAFICAAAEQTQLDVNIFLLKTFSRATLKEAEWLARNVKLLPYFSTVMLNLAVVVTEAKSQNALNNYRHCVVSYGHIVNKFLLPACDKQNKKVLSLLMKLLKIIKNMPTEVYEESFLKYDCLMFEMLTKHMLQPIEVENINKITEYLQQMKDGPAKKILEQKLKTLLADDQQKHETTAHTAVVADREKHNSENAEPIEMAEESQNNVTT